MTVPGAKHPDPGRVEFNGTCEAAGADCIHQIREPKDILRGFIPS